VRPLDSFPAFHGTRSFNTEFIRCYKEKHRNLIDASKEIGLEINVEKTTYVRTSIYEKIAKRMFVCVSQFKIFSDDNWWPFE
jgi:hypothetical protein